VREEVPLFHVHPEGGKFYVVTNLRLEDRSGEGTRCGPLDQLRAVYVVWTGERWDRRRASGITFTTEKQAQHYLDQHLDQLWKAR